MRLPDRVAYLEAIQVPRLAFGHLSHLPFHEAKVRLNALGQPMAASGSFAITFDLTARGRRYAVRCFTQHRDNTERRYRAVARFVRAAGLDFLLQVEYLESGINVEGKPWPIVLMPWVDTGQCLNDWIDANVEKPAALERVRVNIANAVAALRQRGVAHGDLQHGNILVRPDMSIRLIDYDGMYLPELAQYGACEQGHRNYQHPERSTQFQACLDAFSAGVIDLSLKATAAAPKLWAEFTHGDNLILGAADFADPDSSVVFDRLKGIPQLGTQTGRLRDACMSALENVPDVLSGTKTLTATAAPRPSGFTLAPLVFDGSDRALLLSQDGKEVTVVGKVVSVKSLPSRSGKLFSLINFGNHWQGAFTVVAWERTHADLVRNVGEPANLRGCYVAVTGRVSLYQGRKDRPTAPQIELRHARSLRLISQAQADSLLRPATIQPPAKAVPKPPPAPPPAPPASTPGLAARLGALYSSPAFAKNVSAAGRTTQPATQPAGPPTASPTPPPRQQPSPPKPAPPRSPLRPPQPSPPPQTPPLQPPPQRRTTPVSPPLFPYQSQPRPLPRPLPELLRRLPLINTTGPERWSVVALIAAGCSALMMPMMCCGGAVLGVLMFPFAALAAMTGLLYSGCALWALPPDPPRRRKVETKAMIALVSSATCAVISVLLLILSVQITAG